MRRLAAPGFLEGVRESASALRKAALGGPVVELRGAGLLVGLVLDENFSAGTVRDTLLQHGVLVGTSSDPRVLRLMPALVLPPDAPAKLARAFAAVRTQQVTS